MDVEGDGRFSGTARYVLILNYIKMGGFLTSKLTFYII